ncbi:MAG: hypothetical protein U0136_14815 [Bdellovibrionota bacterium]
MSNVANENFARMSAGGGARLPKPTFGNTVAQYARQTPALVGNSAAVTATSLATLAFPKMDQATKALFRSMPGTQPKFLNAIGNIGASVAAKAVGMLTAGAVKLPHR